MIKEEQILLKMLDHDLKNLLKMVIIPKRPLRALPNSQGQSSQNQKRFRTLEKAL